MYHDSASASAAGANTAGPLMSDGSETGATGTAKRQHDATGPPAKRRQTDRVTLDVGGTIFHTTENTLTSSSSYFSRLFSGPWQDAAGDEPRFLDRDADAFRVLLSCLRNRTIVLPEADPALCSRVLLEADFFGVEWLIQEVKARATKNLGEDFDGCFPGGVAEAVSAGALPARWFSPVQKKNIVSLQAVSGFSVQVDDAAAEDGQVRLIPATALAVVQDSATGRTHVEPLIQRPEDWPVPEGQRETDDGCDTNVMLASDLCAERRGHDGPSTWRLRPSPQLLALPTDSALALMEADDDIKKYSIPFVQVTPAEDPMMTNRPYEMKYLDAEGDDFTTWGTYSYNTITTARSQRASNDDGQ